MSNFELNAAYLLVDYAWAVLKINLPDTWSESKYGGLVPIVPLSEEPELEEYSGPHIVYGFADETTTAGNHVHNTGSLSFAIYDQNFRRLTKTINVLRVAFERQDEAATDINRFTSTYRNGAYLSIRFAYTDIGFIEGGTPEETEGGRQSALINIRYGYYQDNDVVTSV